jgi:hypothetical protein
MRTLIALLPALNFFGCSIRPLTLLVGRSGPDLYAGDGLLMFWSHQPIAPWQTQAWIGGTVPRAGDNCSAIAFDGRAIGGADAVR